jgi:acetyltransferase-like isoleucine patch superfamily enzyme
MDKVQDRLAELYHYLATSNEALPQAVRRLKQGVGTFSVPAPKAVVRPLLWSYLAARSAAEFGMRVFVAQPFLQAYCKECGPGLRTGSFIHWVQGQGDIVLGSNVWLDGKSTITFAASFSERPLLEIGDNTAVGHETFFIVGKRITVGKNCNISGSTMIFDSNGHPSDPVARRNHEPPAPDQVRPVTIGDDVWIGKGCIIYPGVRIGDCAIVSGGSVVRRHVPPYAVVAGNPAQVIFRLPRPAAAEPTGGPPSNAPESMPRADGGAE